MSAMVAPRNASSETSLCGIGAVAGLDSNGGVTGCDMRIAEEPSPDAMPRRSVAGKSAGAARERRVVHGYATEGADSMDTLSRRSMMAGAVIAAAGLPGVSLAAESGTAEPRKLRVVVAGGHPGDPEYGCGGTIARYTALGHEVVLLYLNRGEWPENPLLEDAKSVRIAEARKACETLNARPAYAGQINRAAIVEPAHYEQFHRLLEAEQPG